MRQGLVNFLDSEGTTDAYGNHSISWQEWWGEDLTPEATNKLHFENNRYGLFQRAGERIKFRNHHPESLPLSPENTAALGLVALTDFIVYPATGNEVFWSLVNEPLSEPTLLAKGMQLHLALQRTRVIPPQDAQG